jgi:hypothetical protein
MKRMVCVLLAGALSSAACQQILPYEEKASPADAEAKPDAAAQRDGAMDGVNSHDTSDAAAGPDAAAPPVKDALPAALTPGGDQPPDHEA